MEPPVDNCIGGKRMGNGNSTIYDDVLRTIQERYPKLLVPLINEVFHTSFPTDEKVTRLPEGYQKLVSKVVADSCSVIGNHVYHLECQSTKDGTMMLRMAEYDFMIAMAGAMKENGHYRLKMPKSCILYLRGNPNIPDEDALELELADGQALIYRVPNVKLEDYTLDEIFKKNLLIFLPYYILRYEKYFHAIAQDEEKTEKLIREYHDILEQLEVATKKNRDGLFQDLMQLIRRILDYQLRKENKLRERMDKIMGGKVLPLPSDKLREEREKGIESGIETLITTCKEIGVSKEIIENKLKMKYAFSAERIDQYMKKYWK